MRNLKRVLSLALAMVMLLGMMVVGAGATSFKDDSSIPENRAIAVAVANTLEVLLGDENGNFNPNNTLTRAEAAVVLAKLDLGADAAKALTATNAATFNDVGTGYGWAKAYIDYCAGNGYMIGVGGNNFAPGRTLTSVEFATMVSRVLGYKDENEYGKDGWTAVKAAALARKAGLGADVNIANADMSRADMAQMVLNALTAPTVEYTGLNGSIGDATFNSPATVRRHSANQSGQNVTYDGYPIQSNITPIRLCEEKFPTLKLDRQDELDKFGRRCSVWKYKGLKIAGSEGTIVPNLAYNTKVTKDTVADWAKMEGLSASVNPAMQLWINGKTVTPTNFTTDEDGKALDNPLVIGTQGWISRYTAPGREVEVYMNKDNLSVVERVVVVDTVLAEVTKVNSDETISVKLMKTGNAANPDKVTTGAVTLNTTVGYGDVKKGDIVLVQGYGTEKLSKDTTITSVEVAPIVTGFATFKGYNTQTKVSYIKVDGEEYSDAYSVVRDFAVQDFSLNTEDLDCTLYLDNHGNIMKAIPGKDPNAVKDNLVAVKEFYNTLSNGKIVHMVKGVISNGETVTWQVKNSSVTENTIYTWTKADGVYTLSVIRDKDYATGVEKADKESWVATVGTGSAINFKSNDVFGKDEANKVMYSDNVKFIFVGDSITILSGRQTYELKAGKIVAQAFKDGEITAVFINENPDVVDVSDLIYVHSTYRENDQIVDVDGKKVQYHGYTAYDAKGEAIEDFLGTEESMADSFHKTKKTDDGKAYLPNEENRTVKEHTMTKGVVAKANGLSGDAFVLVKFDGTTEKEHFDFMGRKSTKVVDLSNAKRYIESISELNGAVNDGYYVEVAVIFNSTDAKAHYPSVDNVREAVTVFVTTVVKPDADHVIPTHTPSDDPNAGTDTPSTDPTYQWIAPTGTLYSVDGGKTWAKKVECDGKVGTVVLMKPEKDGYFFTGNPAADGAGALNGKTTIAASASVDSAYEIKITTAINDPVSSSAITSASVAVAKPTHATFIPDSSTPAINIRFVDGSDALTTSVSVSNVVAKAKIAQSLLKGDYPSATVLGNGDVRITLNGVEYTVDATNIKLDGIVATVGGGKNYVLSNAGDKNIDDLLILAQVTIATEDVREIQKDGTITVVSNGNVNSTAIKDGANYVVITALSASDKVGATVGTPDENGKSELQLPTTPVTDVNGNPGAVDGSYTAGIGVKGRKMAVVEFDLPEDLLPASDANSSHVVIKQVNSALEASWGDPRISKDSTGKVFTKIGTPIARASFTGKATTLVIDDDSIVTLEFYATNGADDSGSPAKGTIPANAKPFATYTIDTSKLKFAD